MWFNKKKSNNNNEQLIKVVNILVNCHHLCQVEVNQYVDKHIDYRFLDLLTGYYWQLSLKDNRVTIKTGNTILIPKTPEELYKMLDIEISKSMIYETQKQSLLLKKNT